MQAPYLQQGRFLGRMVTGRQDVFRTSAPNGSASLQLVLETHLRIEATISAHLFPIKINGWRRQHNVHVVIT